MLDVNGSDTAHLNPLFSFQNTLKVCVPEFPEAVFKCVQIDAKHVPLQEYVCKLKKNYKKQTLLYMHRAKRVLWIHSEAAILCMFIQK